MSTAKYPKITTTKGRPRQGWSRRGFSEHVSAEMSELWRMYCQIYCDDDFIYVSSDDYEGTAMMTLPTAIAVRRSLGKAIKFMQTKGTQ